MMMNTAQSMLLQRFIYELETRGTAFLEVKLKKAAPELQDMLAHNLTLKRHVNFVIDTNSYRKSQTGIMPILDANGGFECSILGNPTLASTIRECMFVILSNEFGKIATQYYLIRCDKNKVNMVIEDESEEFYRILEIALRTVRQRFVTFFSPLATYNNWEKFGRLRPQLFFKLWFRYQNPHLFARGDDPLLIDSDFVSKVGQMLWKKNKNFDELGFLVTL